MLAMNRCSFVLAAVLVPFIGTTAQAVVVTNLTTKQVLFFDDFEGLGTNVSHATHPDNSGDFDPVAVIGTWTSSEPTSIADIQVTDSTTSPDPGPFEGADYLRFNRTGGFTCAYANLSTSQTVATNLGQTIRLEMAVNVMSDANPAIISMYSSETTPTQMMQLLANADGTFSNTTGSGQQVVLTGLSYTPGEWMRVLFDYTVGAATYSLTIDSTTLSGIPLWHNGDGSVRQFRMAGNANGGTYFDEYIVPEPATIGLVVVGASCLALVLRRRRR